MATIGSNTSEEKINYDICLKQAAIFESAAEKGYNMTAFASTYFNSAFCNKSFDKKWCIYHHASLEECENELYDEIGNSLSKHPNNQITNPEICWWVGFTYRQLSIETGLSGKNIIKTIPFNELYNLYGLHTISETNATDRLCHKYGLTKIGISA